jgi:cold shock CspA family protein
MIGHLKFFDWGRRYGFIVPDGKLPQDHSENVFVHETAFAQGIKGLVDGAEVEYELIPNYGGKKALSARLTGRAYAPVHPLDRTEARKGAASNYAS